MKQKFKKNTCELLHFINKTKQYFIISATCCDYRALVGSNPKATMGLNEAKFGLVAPFWFMDSFIGVVGQRIGDYSLLTGIVIQKSKKPKNH